MASESRNVSKCGWKWISAISVRNPESLRICRVRSVDMRGALNVGWYWQIMSNRGGVSCVLGALGLWFVDRAARSRRWRDNDIRDPVALFCALAHWHLAGSVVRMVRAVRLAVSFEAPKRHKFVPLPCLSVLLRVALTAAHSTRLLFHVLRPRKLTDAATSAPLTALRRNVASRQLGKSRIPRHQN